MWRGLGEADGHRNLLEIITCTVQRRRPHAGKWKLERWLKTDIVSPNPNTVYNVRSQTSKRPLQKKKNEFHNRLFFKLFSFFSQFNAIPNTWVMGTGNEGTWPIKESKLELTFLKILHTFLWMGCQFFLRHRTVKRNVSNNIMEWR